MANLVNVPPEKRFNLSIMADILRPLRTDPIVAVWRDHMAINALRFPPMPDRPVPVKRVHGRESLLLERLPVDGGSEHMRQSMVTDHGFRDVGEGVYKTCLVADVDTDGPEVGTFIRERRAVVVTRKSSGTHAFRRVIDAALDNPHDPFAPKVYGWAEVSGGHLAAEMEVLTPVKAGGHLGTAHLPEFQWMFGGEYGRHPSGELLNCSPYMRQLARLSPNWDLHTGNYMLRGDQPVITDPIC